MAPEIKSIQIPDEANASDNATAQVKSDTTDSKPAKAAEPEPELKMEETETKIAKVEDDDKDEYERYQPKQDKRAGDGDRDKKRSYENKKPFARNKNSRNHERPTKPYGLRTRYEKQSESSDATEILRQVEFYFSDSNLPIDRFLLESTGGPANKPFPLKTIHNFKRMRHFQPFSAIVDAVKQSAVLEVNDQDEVFRKVPLAEKFTLDVDKNKQILSDDTLKRTVYVKGFGYEHQSTGFDIENFFQPYGFKSVRMRRHEDKTFKGSVFVEFEDEATAQTFLDLDEKPKFNNRELLIMSKEAYDKKKAEEPPRPPREQHSDRYSDGRKRKHPDDEGVDDRDDWNKRRDRFQQRNGEGRFDHDRRRDGRPSGPPRQPRNSKDEDDSADHNTTNTSNSNNNIAEDVDTHQTQSPPTEKPQTDNEGGVIVDEEANLEQ